jgi:poly(3-hydroxybutyrate) depolymerase
MLYSLYELNHMAVGPLRAAAMAQSALLRSQLNPVKQWTMSKSAVAAADVFESITRRYRKPGWNLPTTTVNAVEVDVTPQPVWRDTWCRLVHFARNPEQMERALGKKAHEQPRVLICAPLSGHYATLLRGTVEAFLPDHEVYITDWTDARMVPITEGRFDLNDYIDYLIRMLRFLGEGAHVVAVCQPGPLALAAVSVMSAENDPALPATMSFMGSPIDARKSPTVPNKLAESKPFAWFERNMIHTVPLIYPGALREVYPGFLQLASFMGMNWARHVDAHRGYFNNLVKGDGDNAGKHREFYDEYLSVLDLTEEFYLGTIRSVFQEHHLPTRQLMHRGKLVNPDAIRKVALMTVEGENDDISGVGQTQAAHDLCGNIPVAMRIDHLQPDVGHYGVFNGKRFRTEIYPRQREFIRTFDKTRFLPRRSTHKSTEAA